MALSIQELAKIGNITIPGNKANANNESSAFDVMYQSAINMVNETNDLQKNAEQMALDFAIGKVDNVHDVMISQEKASIALQYTVRVKNAILEAYNEIMRIQL